MVSASFLLDIQCVSHNFLLSATGPMPAKFKEDQAQKKYLAVVYAQLIFSFIIVFNICPSFLECENCTGGIDRHFKETENQR